MTFTSTSKLFDQFSSWLFNFCRRYSSSYLSLHRRPIDSNDCQQIGDNMNKLPKFGIMMQGPILTQDNFTLKTVSLYRRYYPNVPIIISVWHTEAHEVLKQLKDLGAKIVVSQDLAFPGWNNINRQIVGCQAGLKTAKKLGCEYVIKTRPDQRFYAPNTIPYLYALLKMFPIQKNLKQKSRIISTSLFSFKYRLYSISDLLLCGEINDLLAYFSPPLDTRPTIQLSRSLLEDSQERMGEMYLSTHYLESRGHKLKWTLTDSWDVYANRFIVIDQQSLDLFWYKYEPYKERRFFGYEATCNSEQLDFKEWILLYSKLKTKSKIPETTLKLGFNDPIANL